MRRAGVSLWSRARAGLGGLRLQSQLQQQHHTRTYASLAVLSAEEGQHRVVEASRHPIGTLFLQVSRAYSPNGFHPEGRPRMVSWQQGGGFRHASTAISEDSKSAEEVSAEGITLTDNCIRRIQEIKREEGPEGENKVLRLSVEGGGCSGFLYNFALDDKVNKDDRVFERDGAKLVVDDISFGFIKGATVDFTEELIRASFAVTTNPNASSACGCGASFNAK